MHTRISFVAACEAWVLGATAREANAQARTTVGTLKTWALIDQLVSDNGLKHVNWRQHPRVRQETAGLRPVLRRRHPGQLSEGRPYGVGFGQLRR
jgi:hypothetical protein